MNDPKMDLIFNFNKNILFCQRFGKSAFFRTLSINGNYVKILNVVEHSLAAVQNLPFPPPPPPLSPHPHHRFYHHHTIYNLIFLKMQLSVVYGRSGPHSLLLLRMASLGIVGCRYSAFELSLTPVFKFILTPSLVFLVVLSLPHYDTLIDIFLH